MPTRLPGRRAATKTSRRDWLMAAAAGAAGAATGCDEEPWRGVSIDPDGARLSARVAPPTTNVGPGEHALGLGAGRDGRLYVPASYAPDRPLPLLVVLHGAYSDGLGWVKAYADDADAAGFALLAPDSRFLTWDVILSDASPEYESIGGFGPDIDFIDGALAATFDRCAIDPTRLAIAGFSDGATYALALGLANGDLFGRTVAFSPGRLLPVNGHGTPRFFVSHGTLDPVLPIDEASRKLVPELRSAGYEVTYVEFDGGHQTTPAISTEALAWVAAS